MSTPCHARKSAETRDEEAVEQTHSRANGYSEDQRGDDVFVEPGQGDDQADSHDRRADVSLDEYDADDDRGDHDRDEQPVEQAGHAVPQAGREDSLRCEARADATRCAGGQVDLTEQQYEHQAERDDRDVGALAGQVADVVTAQEPAAHLAEDDDQRDESEN